MRSTTKKSRSVKAVATYSAQDQLSLFFASSANVDVTPKNAMSCVTVKACISKVAKDIAGFPLPVYAELPDGGKMKIRKHPVFNCLNVSPNGRLNALNWREYIVEQMFLYGNSYAEIEPFGDGTYSLHPLPADSVEVKRNADGSVSYKIKGDTRGVECPQDRMLHFALAGDGLIGASPIKQCKNAIGLLMAMDTFASKFFANGMTTSGVLTTPDQLSSAAKDNLRQSMTSGYTGDNAHKFMVLDEGMQYTPTSVNPEQAQLTTARRMAIQEVCRIFDVDPAMIGEHSESHYNNVSQQLTNYVVHCLRSMCLRIESELNRKLFSDQDEFFVEHDMNSMLRADPETRAKINEIGLKNGYYLVNEVRSFEGLNPIEEPDADANDDTPAIGEEPPAGETPAVVPENPIETSATKTAAINLLTYEIERLLRREKEFAAKSSLKPNEFMANVQNFCVKQKEIAEQNLAPIINLLKTLDINCDDLPTMIVESAQNELLQVVSSAKTDELTQAVEVWSNKRASIIETIKKRIS